MKLIIIFILLFPLFNGCEYDDDKYTDIYVDYSIDTDSSAVEVNIYDKDRIIRTRLVTVLPYTYSLTTVSADFPIDIEVTDIAGDSSFIDLEVYVNSALRFNDDDADGNGNVRIVGCVATDSCAYVAALVK